MVRTKEAKPVGGIIYAIGAEGMSLVKIGYTTTSVEKRLKTLQTGQPIPLCIVATVPVRDEVVRIEHSIHALLAEEHRLGEWFDVPMDAEILETLIGRARQRLLEGEKARAVAQADRLRRRVARQEAKLAAQLANDAMRLARNSHAREEISIFGDRLQQWRERRGWTQRELAVQVKVPYMTIWRIEAGKHTFPRMDVAVRLVRALGVSLDFLCGVYDEDSDSETTPVTAALAGT